MLAFLLGLVLVTAASLVAAAALRVEGRVAYLLAAGVLGAAQVVALALLATPFDALGRGWWLAGHAIVLVLALAAWWLTGRRRPPRGWRVPVAEARAHPGIAAIAGIAALAALVQLIVGLTTTPTNWDSMTYHLSRAAYWLQEGGVGYFEGGSLHQLASPPNAEILVAWTMALSGRETFVELVQWLALLGGAGGIWLVARELGFPRSAAVFAAAIWVLLPGPISQAATTQNDLVVTSMVMVTVAFGLRALRTRRAADIVVCALAFGLGLGAKGSFLFMLPALALLLGLAVWRLRPPPRTVVAMLGAAAVAALALGTFTYAANQVETGGPFGGLKRIQERTVPMGPNLGKVTWSFVESPGIGVAWVDRAFAETIGSVAKSWRTDGFDFTLGTDVDEDRITAGLVGFLVLLPLALVVALRRRTPWLHRGLAVAALSYVVLFGLLHVATPFNGRVLMPAYTLIAPLLALLAVRGWSRGIVAMLAVASLLPVVLTNDAKPLLPVPGEPGAWERTRDEQLTIRRIEYHSLLHHLDARYPARARLVFLGGEDSWDYPLFGPRRERHVTRVDPTKVPRDEPGLCQYLVDLVTRTRADALVFADAPREVAEPPRSMRPASPNEALFVVDGDNVRRCA